MNTATRNYAIVTAAYWGFTLTDGALRMLVLLHFYQLGYSPFTLAFLFLLYEAAGIAANLIGGWLATRFGIAVTFYDPLITPNDLARLIEPHSVSKGAGIAGPFAFGGGGTAAGPAIGLPDSGASAAWRVMSSAST